MTYIAKLVDFMGNVLAEAIIDDAINETDAKQRFREGLEDAKANGIIVIESLD